MTTAKARIIRNDRRIAAQIETLAHLFDVSVSTILRAVESGKIKPSNAIGPKLYRVDDVEKFLFGGLSGEEDAGSAPDPYLDGVKSLDQPKEKCRGAAT